MLPVTEAKLGPISGIISTRVRGRCENTIAISACALSEPCYNRAKFFGVNFPKFDQTHGLTERRFEGMKMNSKRVLTGAMLVAMLVLPLIAAPPDSKSKSATDWDAAMAEKWIAGWNSHDPDKMLPLFTDDIFYEDVAFGEVSHGRAEVRKFFLSELEGVPDLDLKLQRTDI